MNVLLSGCLIAAITSFVAGCHSSESTTPAALQTVQAHVVESRGEQSPLTVLVTGTIHAGQSAIISAQVMGHIQQLLVREGDKVRAGQLLAVLDDSTLRAATDQSSAGLMAAQSQQAAAQTEASLTASTLDRYKQLQAQKSVSPQEMDEVTRRAEASVERVDAMRALTEAAKAQDSGARAMLGYTRLRAPFAGVVTARMADPGTLALPGVPLLQIESDGPLQLQAAVDESAIGAVRKGMKVQVTITGLKVPTVKSTVAEIVPAADSASHSFLIKIDLPSSVQIHSGMYGTAGFSIGTHPATLVPRSAVVMRGSLPSVFVLDSNGVAQLRSIALGTANGDVVEVLSGISSGEKLVNDPADRELAGKKIEAQP